MSFELKKLKNFDNKPIKYKDLNYPQSKNENLPRNYFTSLFIGQTGTGKTHSLIKLLKYYEDFPPYTKEGQLVPQRIILFSPTFRSNPQFKVLKHLDIEHDVFEEYSDQSLQDTIDDILIVKKEADKYQQIISAYRKFVSKGPSSLSNKELMLLYTIDFDLDNLVEPRFKINPVNHLIFDDLVCTGAYKQNGLLSQYTTKCRHINVNIYCLAQSVSQITRLIRTQSRLLILYRYNSKSVVDDIYELVSSEFTPEEFNTLYLNITAEKYQFMTIDNTGKQIKIKKNYDYLITRNNLSTK